MNVDLVVCFSTPLEGSLLVERLAKRSADVALIRTGVGAVNAAHALTMFLAHHGTKAVIACGVGGAYPGSALGIGDVACAESECYGDLGADSPDGFIDMQAMGFPVVDVSQPLYNELPLQIFPTDRRVRFVTVNTCTGTDAAAAALAARTRGAVENMEGAAIAHVGHLHGIPTGEVRGISNYVGKRDTSAWKLREAATAAQEALLSWIEGR